MTTQQSATPASHPATERRTRPSHAARRLFKAAIFLFGIYLALCLLIAWATVRPQPRHLTRTPHAVGLSYENIVFLSADGTPLHGWFIPAAGTPAGLIICCPGVDSTRLAMLSPALILHNAGYAVALFDFRARGESGGNRCTLGLRETDDLLAAVATMRGRADCRNLPIGVLGESMGGAVALMGAARSPYVNCVIAESPFGRLDHAVSNHFRKLGPGGPLLSVPTRWIGEMLIGARCADIAPIREIGRIAPRALLLIEDEADQLCPPSEIRALYAAAREPREIWAVPGADHISAIDAQPEEYARHITSFFGAHLNDHRH